MPNDQLNEVFRQAGATFETVAGQEVAVSTVGLAEEYKAFREGVGIWDHSDMTKVRVAGEGALDLLDMVVSGNIENLQENAVRHTLMLDAEGKIVLDAMVHNNLDEYIVTCAAGYGQRMTDLLEAARGDDSEIEDITDKYTTLVVEGPQAWQLPRDLIGMEATGVRLLNFLECEVVGVEGLLSRIGTSGEYGYIFWVPPAAGADLLAAMQEAFPEAVLCGRAVQDLLRLEMRAFNLPKDIVAEESALQAGLHWMIDFRKESFTGRETIIAEQEAGLSKKLVAFRMQEGAQTRPQSGIFDGETRVGYVANCAFSPTLDCGIGLAYLDAEYGWVGIDLAVEASDARVPMRTVSAPFFLTESNRVPMA
jgi:aminomethyltransferase